MINRWYVKDLSKITGVSVQTLHYYDRINLLKLSVRSSSDYRVYSEEDLARLQQILALKFLGFNLAQVKALLKSSADVLKQFNLQAQILEHRAHGLLEVSALLRDVVATTRAGSSIPWTNIIKLIEVYRMAEKLDHVWLKDVLSPEELREYAQFESELRVRSKPEDEATIRKAWLALVDQIKAHIKQDPKSEIGVKLGGECMRLIDGMYGKKYRHLRTKIFEKGFGEGKGLEEVSLTLELVSWLEKAMDAYWENRIITILSLVGKKSLSHVLGLWNEALDEMYGKGSADRKEAVRLRALEHKGLSKEARLWLESIA